MHKISKVECTARVVTIIISPKIILSGLISRHESENKVQFRENNLFEFIIVNPLILIAGKEKKYCIFASNCGYP